MAKRQSENGGETRPLQIRMLGRLNALQAIARQIPKGSAQNAPDDSEATDHASEQAMKEILDRIARRLGV